jgi:hypothetical protein
LLCFIPGVAEGYHMTLGSHLFGLPKVSQASGWWPEMAAVECGWQPACSLSVLWLGEAFHGLGVQGAKVSTLPCASLPPTMAPASQPGQWFMELKLSATVLQSPFFISFYLLMIVETWTNLTISDQNSFFFCGNNRILHQKIDQKVGKMKIFMNYQGEHKLASI